MRLISLSNRKSAIFWGNNMSICIGKRCKTRLVGTNESLIRFCYTNIILCIGKFKILGRSLDTFQIDGFCNRMLDTLAHKDGGKTDGRNR